MSWSLSISKTPKASFDAAVDAAQASGQDPNKVSGQADNVAAAKAALKSLGARVRSPNLSASASGHTSDGTPSSSQDSISVAVNGQT